MILYLYRVRFISYTSVKEKIDALLRGFNLLLSQDIISIFTVEELDFLISGQATVDVNDWKNNTVYKGLYNENHPVNTY